MLVLALSIFLLAFAGLATDYTSFWFQRQKTQGAADAACQAAAVDLYLYSLGEQTPNMNFVPTAGGAVDCSAAPTAAPCLIAKYNGYDGALAANKVVMTFPANVAGAPPPPVGVAVPYVQVDVTTNALTHFSRLLTGQGRVAIHTTASCGLTSVPGPVPIVVLHPTDPTTIDMSGAKSEIQVVGGPKQSIQVNSNNPSAVTTGSLATVDLSQGGPNFTGSSFGTFGGQPTAPGSVNMGATGRWIYPHLPISDPYAQVAAPAKPGNAAAPQNVGFTVNGCPDTSGCTEYSPGYYAGGIKVKGATAIFDPGLYYLAGNGLTLDDNSIVRTSTANGDGHGGVMFYFSGNGNTSLTITSNSGKAHGAFSTCAGVANNCIVQYHVDGSSELGVDARALQCPNGKAPPKQVPATIPGTVLLAPCDGAYGDPSGEYRGFLFFQDRSIAVGTGGGSPPPSWQGGGSTLAAGFMYFHQCRAGDATGTGKCTAFGDQFNMGGNPGSGSYAVGSLITDKIAVNGNPGLQMILHPDNLFDQTKIGFFK
jgi:hypothetical protein